MLISDCCGAPARCGSEDVGICPICREHTEYIDTEEEEEEIEIKKESK